MKRDSPKLHQASAGRNQPLVPPHDRSSKKRLARNPEKEGLSFSSRRQCR